MRKQPLTSTEKARRRVERLNTLAQILWGEHLTWRTYETAMLKQYRASIDEELEKHKDKPHA